MSEPWGSPRRSSAARGTSAGGSTSGTPRRVAASGEEGVGGQKDIPQRQHQTQHQQMPQQQTQQQQQQQHPRLAHHEFEDYLEETRFGATSMSSWESSSHSFDNEEVSRLRPSSGLQRGDNQQSNRRTKPFDPTTPTLIDEDDVEEEMRALSLQQQQQAAAAAAAGGGSSSQQAQPGGAAGEQPSAGILAARRTPGASSSASGRYKAPSAFGFDEAEIAALRRTPGASAMQRSASSGPDAAGLGYALTLSAPVAEGDEHPSGGGGSDQHQGSQQKPSPIRPPLGSAWSSQTDKRSSGISPRPFSPGLQRLTEDIGNLLHEEEDDDVAMEIPTAFREGASGSGGDWMGSFTVGTNSSMFRQTVPRATTPRDKSRRHGRAAAAPGSFFPNAQQPKPRRNANDVIEFGKTHDRSSPQMLNFGGAFSRPVQQPGFAQGQPPPAAFSVSLSGTGAQPPLFSTHSFDSYQSGNTAPSPLDPFFQPYRFASPSPAVPVQGAGGSFRSATPHQSEMQVTAPVFVPMVTRSTPSPATIMAPPAQLWPPAPVIQHQVPYDRQSHDRLSWHSTPSPYAPFGAANYGYIMPGMQSPSFGDARSAMSPPPPRFAAAQWIPNQSGEMVTPALAASSAMTAPPARAAEGMPGTFVPHVVHASMAGHFGGTSSAGSTLSSSTGTDSSLRVRREARRGKRVGKKPPPKPEAAAAATTSPDPTPIVASPSVAVAVVPKKAPPPSTVVASISAKPRKKAEPRPGSVTDGQGEDLVSASEDVIDPKRAELDESPSVRLAFKEFYKSYRAEERLGLQHAEEFAVKSLQDGSLPESVHWRVYVELADVARRSNRFVEARQLYQRVCQLQPYASQGWIEYSKLEEECGHMNRVTNILHAGLEYCEYNENLLIRAVKHHERMGNLDQARALLARLKHVGVDKVWRTILEGASFEARAGNIIMARKVLKYIMYHVPWYGPLYVEFYRLQRDYGSPADAMSIVERGLEQIPRYGPLWFAALRVCEEVDFSGKEYKLPRTTAMLQRAGANVSKEISWKVHLEASFIFERAAQEQAVDSGMELDTFLGPARRQFALTISTCRLNLRWKVWLAAARMELYAGNTETARTLFLRAHLVAPEKVRSLTFLDFARLHEFTGDIELARALLCKGCCYYGQDWKVWLEQVLLETREYNHKKAFEIAKRALEIHPGTGRLWSALVQLSFFTGGDNAQYDALRNALNAVPKSGEVWCEGARIRLNPCSDLFDVDRARRHLFFAEKFTPQYGDTFLEAVRLELLDQWMNPIAETIWAETKSSFTTSSKMSKNLDRLTKYITDVTLAVSCARQSSVESKNFPGLAHEAIIPKVRSGLFAEDVLSAVDLSVIVRACSNADPNYGPLWFNCRQAQTDPPRRVIEHAAMVMLDELRSHAHVYLAAMVRRRAIISTISDEMPMGAESAGDEESFATGDAVEVFDLALMEWEDRVDDVLRGSPSLRDIFNPVDPTTGLVLLQSTISGSDFVTGLMDFNRHRPIEGMSLSDRKRAIFATDALFP